MVILMEAKRLNFIARNSTSSNKANEKHFAESLNSNNLLS